MAMTRTFGAIAALGAASALTLTALPAQAAGSYVALGDSYSSGTGTRSYINDGTSCQRSVYAYPSLIAASKGLTLNFRACSGATVADVTSTQLSALSASTTKVSISVGGNDAGFADVLTECAQPGWASDCNGAIDDAQYIIDNVLPGRALDAVRVDPGQAPNAKVVVVGYPRIFMGEDCNAFTWFSPAEETRLNAMADLLNSKTSAQASARRASPSPTRRAASSATPSATAPSGSTGSRTRSRRATTPTSPGTATATPRTVSTPLTGSAFRSTATTLPPRVAERGPPRDATAPVRRRRRLHHARRSSARPTSGHRR